MRRRWSALGAGEILLTSMDRDGTRKGFDLELTRAIADAVTVPVIASGGVGTLDHLVEGVREGHASAVLAASIFHYGEHSIGEAKRHMAAAGLRHAARSLTRLRRIAGVRSAPQTGRCPNFGKDYLDVPIPSRVPAVYEPRYDQRCADPARRHHQIAPDRQARRLRIRGGCWTAPRSSRPRSSAKRRSRWPSPRLLRTRRRWSRRRRICSIICSSCWSPAASPLDDVLDELERRMSATDLEQKRRKAASR